VKFFFCEKMCEIRKCCTEKSHPHCAVCDDYACDRLSAFFGQWRMSAIWSWPWKCF
jgi:hypothetical protein